MQVASRVLMKRTVMRAVTSSTTSGENGVVFLDRSLKPIAVDHGAAAILGHPNSSGTHGYQVRIPEEVLNTIRNHKPQELSSVKAHFRNGDSEYVCQFFLVEPLQQADVGQQILVLHLKQSSAAYDPVHEFSEAYHLTERERQTLRGIALGLSGKQLAERMHISPNTVRVFVRLIMAKLGVSTRAEIVAKLLEGEPSKEPEATIEWLHLKLFWLQEFSRS